MYGGSVRNSLYIEDYHVTEAEKSKEGYLKDTANFWITNLFRFDEKYQTYRNYYNGVRDAAAFEHITDNYGIGTPGDLGFTPIIKPRIDSLLSQLEIETFNYSVSCTDESTIASIRDQKEQKRLTEISKAVDGYIGSTKALLQEEFGKEFGRNLKKINKKYQETYVDDFVAAAINVLRFFEANFHADVRQKLKLMLLDLLVTGECYYRVYIKAIGADPILEVIKPENIFFNKNTNSQYIDTSDAIVRREYMTRKAIMAEYGKFMDKEQKDYVFGSSSRLYNARSIPSGPYLDRKYFTSDNHGQKSWTLSDTIEVFHVEWLALNPVDLSEEEQEAHTTAEGIHTKVNKKLYRVDRYEATRIAGTVYVNAGKSKYISRTKDRPYECGFTYDGVLYNDRNGTPYSLVGAMKDLQDAYDLIIFHRDNLVANSGVSGDRVNLAAIPKVLGNDFMERLFKFMALKKNGVELYNPTEPGAQLFQHYGAFDNSVNGQSITAINSILEMIQHQADLIAGTNQQMLGQIAERDAVSNVKMGIQRSLMRNQDLFEIFRNIHNRMLNHYVAESQTAYKKGKRGSYIMGPKTYTFEIIPDNYCFTDFAITISYSSKDEKKVQDLQMIAKEFAKNGMIDPPTLAEAVMSESSSEINKLINRGYRKMKEENDELGQAKSQIDELSKNMGTMEKELTQAKAQIEKFLNMNLDLKEREVGVKEKVADDNKSIKDNENETTAEHYRRQDELKTETVQLEREQLHLETGPAKEIKNNI